MAQQMTESQNAGRTLPGGYTVYKPLDKGAFAVVYDGVDRDGHRVAVKVLRSDHPQAYKRFLREIKIMQALPSSQYVVEYFDNGELPDGTPFLVMEHLRGFTLARLLESGKRLTESAACALMMELCEAFQGLHKLGMTHGDIKPANIMLHKTAAESKGGRIGAARDIVHLAQVQRSGMHIKLLDFGLVRDSQGLLKLLEDEDFLTGEEFHEDIDTGMLGGTPEYIAPEQVGDARISDRRFARTDTYSDVFGLGVIFFELLAGEPPWPFRPNANNAQEYNQQVKRYLDDRCNGNYRLEAPPNTSPALWSVLARSLNADPKKRQGTGAEFRADIERYVEFGVGVPGDLDQDETVMAYLPGSPAAQPAPSKTLSSTPSAKVQVGSMLQRGGTSESPSVEVAPPPAAPLGLWVGALLAAAAAGAALFFLLH